MHISLTIDNIIDLAEIGRRHVLHQRAENKIVWIGPLPPERELEKARKYLTNLNHGDKVVSVYENK